MSLTLSLGLALDTSLEHTCCLGKAVGRRKEPWQGLWVSPCVCGDGSGAEPGSRAAALAAVPPPRAVWQGCRLRALQGFSSQASPGVPWGRGCPVPGPVDLVDVPSLRGGAQPSCGGWLWCEPLDRHWGHRTSCSMAEWGDGHTLLPEALGDLGDCGLCDRARQFVLSSSLISFGVGSTTEH